MNQNNNLNEGNFNNQNANDAVNTGLPSDNQSVNNTVLEGKQINSDLYQQPIELQNQNNNSFDDIKNNDQFEKNENIQSNTNRNKFSKKIIILLFGILIIIIAIFIIIGKTKLLDNDSNDSNNNDINNNINDGSRPINETSSFNVEIGDSKKLSSNPGNINNFTFEMNDQKYEFVSRNNIYLYSYSQFMKVYKTDYPDQNGIVGLVINISDHPLRLVKEYDENISINNIASKGKEIASNGDVKIYKITKENNKIQYDVVWGEFLWSIYNMELLITYGIPEKTIFENIYNIPTVIKKSDSNNSLGEIDDLIIQTKIMDSYRYALRESPESTYSASFNVDSGNTIFKYNCISINYNIDYNGKYISIDYENNSDYDYSIDEKYEDTGIVFSKQRIYKYVDNLYKDNYVIISEDKKSRIHIHPGSYDNLSSDSLQNILKIAFEEIK